MDRLLELTSQAEDSHFWFRGFRRFVASMLDRAAAGRRGLRILDCGCGTGYNLRELARYGDVVGTDLSAAGLSIARAARHRVARGDVTRLPFPDHQFDLATTFDMLQCVPHDEQALAEMRRVLKPGGMLVGTVAALPILHGDHSVLSQEVRRYTRGDLRARLQRAGFDPIEVRFAFASLFPLMLALRAAQRFRGARAGGLEITTPAAPINAMLTALVTADAALTRRVPLPFGSSLVFLARSRSNT